MERKPLKLLDVINNIKGVIWLVFLIGGIGGSFALSQYKIGELQQQIGELKGNTKDIVILQTDSKNVANSINELKETNRQIYELLLNMSNRSNGNRQNP